VTNERSAFVYVDLEGVVLLAGRLWSRVRNGRESATFEYAEEWRAFEGRFALDPALSVGPGPHHTPAGKALFSALGDSSPDRWGRTLVARRERALARSESRPPRPLWEFDFLLGVSDFPRQGALRFALEQGGPFLADESLGPVPPVVDLPRLLAASERVLEEEETTEDLRLLLAPGSSLGGARPKASVRDEGGCLSIAKFPARSDDYDVVRWEAVALTLASQAGIEVPDFRLEMVTDKPVLLLRRFDREEGQRRPFLSAMSMLGAVDGDQRSYMEIADALRQNGVATEMDLHELWRRVVFNVLISNTDDHLRNHGFLYAGSAGWRLSPAYDMNPVPTDVKPRVLSTAIGYDDDASASLDRAMEVADYFALGPEAARDIACQVGRAVLSWREVAARWGIGSRGTERMASAFEHDDLRQAAGIPQ
jgi:serine/threonine-protein kinase HipA